MYCFFSLTTTLGFQLNCFLLESIPSLLFVVNSTRGFRLLGDDTGNAGPAAAHKDVTMAEKRDKAKKLSDASLGMLNWDI